MLVHLLEAVGTGTDNPAPHSQLGYELEQPVKTPGKLFLLPSFSSAISAKLGVSVLSQLMRNC